MPRQSIIREWFFMTSDRETTHTFTKEKKMFLCGRTYNNSDYDDVTMEYSDGHRIITSFVVNIEDNVVRTQSGSLYTLEGPHNEDPDKFFSN